MFSCLVRCENHQCRVSLKEKKRETMAEEGQGALLVKNQSYDYSPAKEREPVGREKLGELRS